MKKEIEEILNEIKNQREVNKQSNDVGEIPLQQGDILTLNSESIRKNLSVYKGKSYLYINFVSSEGRVLSEKHFIKRNNGLPLIGDTYIDRLTSFVELVENGLILSVREIRTTPNIFGDSGRTNSYIFDIIGDGIGNTEFEEIVEE